MPLRHRQPLSRILMVLRKMVVNSNTCSKMCNLPSSLLSTPRRRLALRRFPVSTLAPPSSSPHSRPAPVAAATSPKPVPQYPPTQFQQPPQSIVSPKPKPVASSPSGLAPAFQAKSAAQMPPPPPAAGPTFIQDTVPVKSPLAKPAVASSGALSVDVPSRPSSATSIRSISTAGSVTPTTHATAFDFHEEGAPDPLSLPDAHTVPLPSSPRGASASTSPGSATSSAGNGLVRPAPLRTNAPLPVKCTTCGTFGPAGGRFCAWCGSPLTDAAPPPKVSYPTTPPPVAIPTMRGPFQVHLVGSKVPLVAFSPRGFVVVSFPRSTLRYSNDPAITKPAIKLFAGPIRFERVSVRDEDELQNLDEGALLEPGSSVDRSRAIALRWLDKSTQEVASDVDALASGEAREHALDKHLLMRVLHALVASIGSGVPSDYVVADVVREHLVKFGVLADDEATAGQSAEAESGDEDNKTKVEEDSKNIKDPIMLPLYNLLLNANKLPDAVELCLRNNNWSMAMALAGRCPPDVWARANGMFAKYGLVWQAHGRGRRGGKAWRPVANACSGRRRDPALCSCLAVCADGLDRPG
ncbi:hypothetical protein BCR44DRAFT_1329705 [Catenaria anguillulae PL171]|uniref:Sec16 central conserved domain-containing protein n=1 Tax=Catenaria anguillulae PL171 TaxID=765915 RepID=A0A1Y2H6F1_9FUNG|nr:hypothetical protein BCR44DRAFT_1329705 [Catenaria anguillulae PL171]